MAMTIDPSNRILSVTIMEIPGRRIASVRGMVRGITVRSPTISQGFMGGLKQFVGGNIGAYTEMCEQARSEAHQLMLKHAHELGCNAVVGVRYESSDVGAQSRATEVLCYGTGVVVE